MTSEYDPEDLKKATQELAALTPEEYLDIMDAMRKYQQDATASLPEAPASLNFVGYDPVGFRIQFTLRDSDEFALMSRYTTFRDLLNGFDVTPTGSSIQTERGDDSYSGQQNVPPQTPVEELITSPGDVDLNTSAIDRFEVETINHQVTTNGKHYLLVKGGNWQQYGWKAWPEVLPASINVETMRVGTAVPPSEDVAIAYADKEKKKIVAFARRS